MGTWIERHERPLAAALVLAACAFAWSQRLVLDDAYISFQYARNLVEGHGLVWNPGERVEGYTNFLWTLWLVLPHALGIDPVAFCHAHVPLFVAASLLATRSLAGTLGAGAPGRLLAMAVVGAHPSFAAFASGGLETGAVTALGAGLLAVAARAFANRSLPPGTALGIGAGAAALVMLRLDALWVAAGVGALSCAAAWQEPAGGRARAVARLALPPLVLLGAWFLWRHAYYGAWLPNTFAAKVGGARWAQGTRYLGLFANWTWIVPALAVVVAALPVAWRAAERRFAIAAVTTGCVAIHALWVAYVGGDFMEFRFLVPLLPLFGALFPAALAALSVGAALRTALTVALFAGWLHLGLSFPRITAGVESLSELRAHVGLPGHDWRGIGRALGAAFGGRDVKIAVSAAGVIPYVSRLPALDMLGMNDREVARHGIPVVHQPGHVRVAPVGLLAARGVNLVIGHPWVVAANAPAYLRPQVRGLSGLVYLVDAKPGNLPPNASLLEIPLAGGRLHLIVLYLTPHPAVERAVRHGGWRRIPIPWPGATP